MKRSIRNLGEMEQFAQEILSELPPCRHATLVALSGNLGAGKTAFVKCIARFLGVTEEITSPTFVIEKIYKLQEQKFAHLIHIDAYRLDSGSELANLGWREISENPSNIIFLEWPERVAEILPKDMKKIYFTFIDETTREVEV